MVGAYGLWGGIFSEFLMSRLSLLSAAALAVALSACAGQRSDDTSAAPAASAQTAAPAATAAPPPPPPAATTTPTTPGTYTDDKLRSFITASTQIEPISRTLATATPEQRTAATNQIRTILQTNNITADEYNAIATQARTDAELSARITALQAPADAPTTPQ